MKNRYGVEYCFVKYDDNLYRFNMGEGSMNYMRFGGREYQEKIDMNDLGFFDPSGGPFVEVGGKIYWDQIHEGVEQEPLTVTRIMNYDVEGLFVEVE